MTEDDVTKLASKLGRACRKRRVAVATAESCTGGGVAEAITRVAGSSGWFDRGFVTYTNTAKKEMLGVSGATLAAHGAVSRETAGEMAQGALAFSHADVSVAVTGIAGPGGAVRGKPVGTVHFAWTYRTGSTQHRKFIFRGDRAAVRLQSVAVALQWLLQLLR